MSEWKKVKLGDILQVKKGDYITKKEAREGIYPVILGGKEPAYFIDKYNHTGKAIVISRSGASAGYVSFWNEPIFVTDGFLIEPKGGMTYEFLYYALKSKQAILHKAQKGAAIPHVTPLLIGNIDFLLPNKDVQHRIATILSRYDSLIENYQKQIKLLEEAAQRLYKEWFVDLHFPGHENVKIVDGVPEGWEKKKVGDFVTFYDKQRKPLSSMQRMNMEKIYPYYGAASLMDYVDNYLFDGIYLLFGEDGTVITPDNHPVLQYVWGKFWVNNHAHVLRGKDRISTEFLYVLFRNITISDVVTGAAQPKISQGRLSEKMAMLPPITLIEKWSSIAGTYFFQLRNLSSQIHLLTEARDRLLPKLMSGEIAV
jgi:type I restriction enzyme S subunit